MSFRSIFIALIMAFALVLGAFLIQRARPRGEVDQPNAAFVRATGKCAEWRSARMALFCTPGRTFTAGPAHFLKM